MYPLSETSQFSVTTRDSNQRSTYGTLIDRLISRVEDRLDDEKTKLSVSDYIRLVQLKLELEGEETPQKVEVRWIDPDEVAADTPEDSAFKR